MSVRRQGLRLVSRLRGREQLQGLRVFCLGIVLLCLWIALQSLLRHVTVADEFRYLAPGYRMVIGVGSVRAVWDAFQEHFGAVINDRVQPGLLAARLHDVSTRLESKGLSITTPEDVAAYGIDITRGALIGLYDDGMMMVVSLSGEDRLDELLGKWAEATVTAADPIGSTNVTRVGRLLIARVSSTTALISSSRALVEASLRTGSAARVGLDDSLYEAAGLLGGPMLTGPAILVHAQGAPVPVLTGGSFVVRFEPQLIRIDAVESLRPPGWRSVRSFFDPPAPEVSWAAQISALTPAVGTINDWHITDYIRLLGGFPELAPFIRQRYGSILWELQSVKQLHQVTVSLTGYHDGVPEFMLGVWGDRQDLDAVVERLQTRFRRARDTRLLAAALAKDGEATDVPALFASGALTQASGEVFERYAIVDRRVEPEARLNDVVTGESYETRLGSVRVRFLLPPITPNDVAYQPELVHLLRAGGSERYRIAVARDGDVHWFATDAEELRQVIDGQPIALPETPQFAGARRQWSPSNRIRLYLNVDEALKLALLSPETAIRDRIGGALLDLRDHPTVTASVQSEPSTSRVRADIRLIQRKGL